MAERPLAGDIAAWRSSPPPVAALADDGPVLPLDRTAVELVAALRAAGVAVPTGATVTYARALMAAGSTPSGAYWAGRATLVRRPEDIGAYDRAFGEVSQVLGILADDIAQRRLQEVATEVSPGHRVPNRPVLVVGRPGERLDLLMGSRREWPLSRIGRQVLPTPPAA